jgi:hypothetical protein
MFLRQKKLFKLSSILLQGCYSPPVNFINVLLLRFLLKVLCAAFLLLRFGFGISGAKILYVDEIDGLL